MKVLKAFRLSEEAIKVLEEQRHATEFLEDLILGYAEKKMEVVPLHQLQALFEEFGSVPQLVRGSDGVEASSFTPPKVAGSIPATPTLGMACCLLKTPCRHWSYANEVWTNSLTGEVKEVNA